MNKERQKIVYEIGIVYWVWIIVVFIILVVFWYYNFYK